MRTLNCKGKLIDLSTPKIMGIINVTPDSFYDGGKTTQTKDVLIRVEKMLTEGATFLDIGGYSTRPGAATVSTEEELKRVLPVLKSVVKEFPAALVSIDTFRANAAAAAIDAGAAIVNDISAGHLDPEMIPTVAKAKVPYIMMHMRGTPQTMTTLTDYKNITKEVLHYFSEKIAQARAVGIDDLIADPGFGFAKTRTQNFELLNNLELFDRLQVPCLVGISRKSTIYKTLQTTPEEALNGTTVLHTVALLKGASILRVHDVKEAQECVTLLQNLKNEAL